MPDNDTDTRSDAQDLDATPGPGPAHARDGSTPTDVHRTCEVCGGPCAEAVAEDADTGDRYAVHDRCVGLAQLPHAQDTPSGAQPKCATQAEVAEALCAAGHLLADAQAAGEAHPCPDHDLHSSRCPACARVGEVLANISGALIDAGLGKRRMISSKSRLLARIEEPSP